MTQGQIKAINDAMSFLKNIWAIKDLSRVKESGTQHLIKLLDAGVEGDIVEHFGALLDSHIRYVEEYGPYCD